MENSCIIVSSTIYADGTDILIVPESSLLFTQLIPRVTPGSRGIWGRGVFPRTTASYKGLQIGRSLLPAGGIYQRTRFVLRMLPFCTENVLIVMPSLWSTVFMIQDLMGRWGLKVKSLELVKVSISRKLQYVASNYHSNGVESRRAATCLRNPLASYDYYRWSKRYQGQEGCYKSIYWRSLEGTNGNAHWLQFVYILESFVTRTPFSVGRFKGSGIVKLSKEYIAFRIQKGTKTVRPVYL